MIRIQKILDHYNYSQLTIGILGSHSALDVCRGANDEGFQTLVIAQTGREKTYHDYYRTNGSIGCIDSCIILSDFNDLLSDEIQEELRMRNVIFVPHRSFEAYLKFNYNAIENDFAVPMFGNRYLLKVEERATKPNQYDLLKGAGIGYPRQFQNPKDIDRLCLVKVQEKARGFERAFFLVNNFKDYERKVRQYLVDQKFTKEQLKSCVIEEFIVGVQVNFNFFYSPLSKRLELLGTDTRRQTNFEGIIRTPITYQNEVIEQIGISYEEAGHIAVTVLESLLEQAFELGERFVKTTQKLYPPGIIGTFALQSIIVPGPPKKDIIVIDVSPRVPGSPGISTTPYSAYLYGRPMSVGRRIALEIKEMVRLNRLKQILS